ncbi:clavesin-2-like isoform X2 [Argiope bruennichi]|uniref:clavesin-2-like isoform X2 n=2 Tax=Argiope bruennichi TaxID=94029 RepID=UPI002494CEF1|nr:clavesin-2-like isoform X2 [Argiope bruennichi]
MESGDSQLDMSSGALKLQEKELLPFEIDYLPEFAAKKCQEELNETPERKIKGIQELRALLQRNPKTSALEFHDDFLVAYLRRNKYRTKDALQQILKSQQLVEAESDLFRGVPEEYLDSPAFKNFYPLPVRCQDGCGLIYFGIGKWDPTELPLKQLKQMIVMFLAQALRDPMNQINGFKVLYDLEGLSTRHIKYITPQNMLLLYNGAVNTAPARYKAVHVINQSPLVKFFWSFVRPILTEKIKSRVHFHKNKEELLDYFPRCVLPVDFGGNVRENETINWIRRANKDQEKFTLCGQPNYY